MSSTSPLKVKKPENIFELKESLGNLITNLEPSSNTRLLAINDLSNQVKNFLLSKYDASTHKAEELDANEIKIKSIEAFDTKYSPFVTACEQYVDQAKLIFNVLDNFIEPNIKIDESFYSEFKDKFSEQITPITDAIEKLKNPVPDVVSGSTLSDDDKKQKEINKHLDALNTFLQTMIETFSSELKLKVDAGFSVDEVIKIVESDPVEYDRLISEQINKILDSILVFIDDNEKKFMELLLKTNPDSSKIILDPTTITTPFDELITGLKKTFEKDSSDNDSFYIESGTVYTSKIKNIIKIINAKVVELDPVPEMPDEVAPPPGGGGDGNGNASTFATYPVSNKSHKNRNNGKGKGKGKGKGRKPNATKKNNRR